MTVLRLPGRPLALSLCFLLLSSFCGVSAALVPPSPSSLLCSAFGVCARDMMCPSSTSCTPAVCGESCFCGSDERCHELTDCKGATCESTDQCGSQCFCADGFCVVHAACAGSFCSDGICSSSNCFCNADGICSEQSACSGAPCDSSNGYHCGNACTCFGDNTCDAPSNCDGKLCGPELSCGSECTCYDGNTCGSNSDCAGRSCASSGECGPSCVCGEQGVCVSGSSNNFGDMLQSVVRDLTPILYSVTDQQLRALGFADVTIHSTAGVTVDANTCSKASPTSATEALANLGYGFASMVSDISDATLESNTAVANAVTAYYLRSTVQQAFLDLTPSSYGGFGLGAGVRLFCAGEASFGFGAGGGAGTGSTAANNGYGGGGGSGEEQPVGNANVGGGGDCACPTATCTCNSNPDSSPSVSVREMGESVRNACSGLPVVVCVQAGGGAGLTAGDCRWDGGFSITGYGQFVAPSSSDSTLRRSAAPLPEAQVAAVCAASGGSDIIGNISRECAAKCGPASNFEECFCPCFKSGLQAAGIPWANTIQCQSSTPKE